MPKRMHCQETLLEELPIVSAQAHPLRYMLACWALNIDPSLGYSTSAHLCTLVDICFGLGATRIGEIGFGRSSFVLGHVALLNGGDFITCDRFDYSYMLDAAGIDWVTYLQGDSGDFWTHPQSLKGFDFLFLDYMSTRKKSVESCYKDLKRAVKLMARNGIIAVHDALPGKYNVATAVGNLQRKYQNDIETLTLPYGFGLALIRRTSASKHGTLKDTWKKKPDAHTA